MRRDVTSELIAEACEQAADQWEGCMEILDDET
jgi:hypothetical protein